MAQPPRPAPTPPAKPRVATCDVCGRQLFRSLVTGRWGCVRCETEERRRRRRVYWNAK